MSGCGGGSVAPTTTALASPRRIASIPSLSATPNVEQAATGENASPVMLPSIDTCAAGVLWRFHTTSAETSHGASGAPHCCCSLLRSGVAGADDVDLAALDAAGDAGLLDRRQRGEVLRQLRRLVGPVALPGVDGRFARVGIGMGGGGRGRRLRDAIDRVAAVGGEVLAKRAVALRLAPEAIPAPLRVVQLDAGVVELADVTEAGADVDVRLQAELLQGGLEAGVLAEALDERADRVERRPVHLLLELREAARREARGDPLAVVGEAEGRVAGEEVAGSEAVERRQPAVGGVEVGGEGVDVG